MAKPKQFAAKFNSKCHICGEWMSRGEMVKWAKGVHKVEHVTCPSSSASGKLKLKPKAKAKPTLELSPLKPSSYQTAVFEDLTTGHGNRVVEAVAGSGKTWTLVEALKRLIMQNPAATGIVALFLAFNKHIAKELQSKVEHPLANISTAHSFGLKVLRTIGKRFKVDPDKTKRLLFNRVFIYDDLSKDEVKELYRMLPALSKLVSLGKGHIIRTPFELKSIWKLYCDKFDITIPNKLTRDFESVLIETYKACIEDTSLIDFDDMIFMPLFLNLSVPTYPFVFIDEAQDLNPAQQELVRLTGIGGRIIAVGDRAQAIYGFTGADTNSIPNLIATLDATVLPLSICYRCGSDIVAEAQTIVPHIEATDGAAKGEISTIQVEDFVDSAKDGDMGICRVTAPLVQHCLDFIRRGRKAVIIGRDIARDLQSLIKSLTDSESMSIPDFCELLSVWVEAQTEKLSRSWSSTAALIAVNDKFETLVALSDNCHNVRELIARIDSIFSDEESSGITLSTIHRAKGLEADNVYILRPDFLPHPLAEKDWQLEQEENLRYVAITRAKNNLVYVEGDAQKE